MKNYRSLANAAVVRFTVQLVCNQKQQIILSKKLNSAMRTTVYRLNLKYNQRDRCKERNYGPAPVGCYINYLPLHYNLPSFGKIAD